VASVGLQLLTCYRNVGCVFRNLKMVDLQTHREHGDFLRFLFSGGQWAEKPF